MKNEQSLRALAKQSPKNLIYLDNAATTKVDPRVLDVMLPYLKDDFGNSSSQHIFGTTANTAIDTAREQVSQCVGCDAKEIIFTSGATESSNLAIKGIAEFYRGMGQGNHLITLKTEHKATLDTLSHLEKLGYEVTYLTPKNNGLVDLQELENAIKKNTILVSLAFVNSEVGTIQDIKAVGDMCKQHNVYLHIDAAQAVGKVDFNVSNLNVAAMSFSAHKVYGPKGVGALYVRRSPRVRLMPQTYGGGQERGLRAGTLATHQIVGMGMAFSLAKKELTKDLEHITKLRDLLYYGLKQRSSIVVNGDFENRVPHNLNVSIKGISFEQFIQQNQHLVLVSHASACMSDSYDSYVLHALGVDEETMRGAIRFSLGRFNTIDEINYVLQEVKLCQ